MTMFSMKPKFDLAKFLAVPAPVGAARSGAARRRANQFQSGATSNEAATPTPSDESGATDKTD